MLDFLGLTPHFKYLWYVLRHKWFVFVECLKYGIPLLGLFHDLSKFSFAEWSPYVNYFYGYKPTDKEVKLACSCGVYLKSTDEINDEFNTAWNHHQKRNKHHWQYWVLREDNGKTIALPMPDRYRKELLADWRGCGKALGKPDTKQWYLHNRDKMVLHKDTRDWIEKELECQA